MLRAEGKLISHIAVFNLLKNNLYSQQTLDGSLVALPPKFTSAGLMDYIIELIVSEDDVRVYSDHNSIFSLIKCVTGYSTCR